jgi:hypothetical protein
MTLSPAEAKALREAFLPPAAIRNIPPGGFPVRIVPPSAIKPPPVTDATIQRDRALGQYGYNLVEQISKDYAIQVDRVWKPALNDAVAAFATAVERRNNTLKIAEAEKAEKAAFNAFVFSLLTAGAMRFVGAYVQYAFVPSFKVPTYSWDISKGIGVVPKLNVNYAEKFSKLQQSAFGGIAQDIGNRAAGLLLPKPKQASYDFASWSGVINLQTDLNKSIEESAKAVLEQFAAVQTWMNDDAEFGSAWMKISDGKVENARALIKNHIVKIRETWAAKWEFFGKSPIPVARALLADHYERTLWAGYLVEQLANTMFFDNVAEAAVVNRLKLLNVVLAETTDGIRDQANRMIEGAPRPTMKIEGAINDIDEWGETEVWAYTHLRKAPLDAKVFQPEARPRPLPPL